MEKLSEELIDDPMVVVLEEPIIRGNEEPIQYLKFVKPKGKHLRKWPANPGMNDMLKLAGKLTLQPDSVFDEMDSKDVTKVLEFVGDLL